MIVEERFEDREAGNKIETQIGQVGKGGLPPLVHPTPTHRAKWGRPAGVNHPSRPVRVEC